MLAASASTPTHHQDPLKTTWSAFKSKRTNTDLYADNAVVVFVPTSVGARGNAHIRRLFLHPHFSDKNVSVQEQVYNTIASDHQLFEEATWTIHFHTTECNWLVPQLDERFLVDATIKVLMTTSVSFEENKITSIRYYWDQASVLKQLKVISEKSNWPVVGEQQVETLVSLETAKLKDLNGEPIQAQDQKTATKPSNGPTSRNIFTYQPPAERRLVAPSNKLNSSFTFSHDDGQTTTTKQSPQHSQNLPVAGKVTPRINRSIIG